MLTQRLHFHQAFVQDCIEKTNTAKQICFDTFQQLGLDYITSSTNFILFNIDKIAEKFSQGMKNKNIQVQFREHYGGKWCRVTMGTIEEMREFTNALREIAAWKSPIHTKSPSPQTFMSIQGFTKAPSRRKGEKDSVFITDDIDSKKQST